MSSTTVQFPALSFKLLKGGPNGNTAGHFQSVPIPIHALTIFTLVLYSRLESVSREKSVYLVKCKSCFWILVLSREQFLIGLGNGHHVWQWPSPGLNWHWRELSLYPLFELSPLAGNGHRMLFLIQFVLTCLYNCFLHFIFIIFYYFRIVLKTLTLWNGINWIMWWSKSVKIQNYFIY